MSLEYPSIPSSPTTFGEWRGQLPHAGKRLLHKVSHSQQGTCQCKYSIGTWLPPTIMLVDYAQKLALIFIVTFFKWSDQQWCHIAWDSFEIVARRTQTKQAVNRSKLVHNWLNLGFQELSLSMTTMTPIMPSNVPTTKRMKTSATLSPVPTGVLLRHATMLVRLSGRRSKATWLVHHL